jgi:dihydroxyacetone kinase-like protein
MTTLPATTLRAWLLASADQFAVNADRLSALDAAIGDGDHGHNMARGFAAVASRLTDQPDDDPGVLLRLAGSTLISTTGGASGVLFGTALLRAAAPLAGKTTLTTADLATAWRAALDGVIARGKAAPGEKTMLDALLPAVEALEAAAALDAAPVEALHRASDAAERGASATAAIAATKGRASYLGERSTGHEDPGAASLALLLRTLADTATREPA